MFHKKAYNVSCETLECSAFCHTIMVCTILYTMLIDNLIWRYSMILLDGYIVFLLGVLLYEVIPRPQIQSGKSTFHLLLGEDTSILHRKIYVDMSVDSHVLIVGLSNCGKSKLAEGMLRDKDVIVVNAFEEDFQSIKGARVIGEDNILEFLRHVLDDRTIDSKPLYLLVDELVVLLRNKSIAKELQGLLCIARHTKLYIVALSQEGTKEVISFKNLFNVRIMMKAIEESTYRTVLGASVEDTNLKQREFYVRDNNGIRRGRSLDIS